MSITTFGLMTAAWVGGMSLFLCYRPKPQLQKVKANTE